MVNNEIISWLLAGDISIQFQTYRDLLGINKPGLQKKMTSEGWALIYFQNRKQDGYWGQSFYQPKWTSTHYTLLDLKNLNISPDNRAIKETLYRVLKNEKGRDGGIYPIGTLKRCDICLNGMFLNYACYFNVDEDEIKSVVDFLLSEKMKDGGFNCLSNRTGAVHSSLHTTLSVLEGILEYERNGYTYRIDELKNVRKEAHEFIFKHRLFRSDKTGEIINPAFIKLHYPCRWHYDILRALDYFQDAKTKYDERMEDALELILKKRTNKDQWNLAAGYKGQSYFDMEQAGKPSRWNTLRALRVLQYFGKLPKTFTLLPGRKLISE